MLKNCTVEYDYTVRNSDGRIIQFLYGGDGIAPAKQYKIDGSLQCHLATKIEELNTEFEMECYKSGTKIDIFKKESLPALALIDPDDPDISPPTPINSGSDAETPDSAASQGSIENDFDD
jgi:hypothetical protein